MQKVKTIHSCFLFFLLRFSSTIFLLFILDCKRARAELKKRSTDTLRLQKKVRKGASGDLQKRLEYGLQDVNERRQLLEENEKQAVRAALLEERSRFCAFVGFLKPVVVSLIFILFCFCVVIIFSFFF